MLLLASKVPSAAPVMSPPLAAIVKSFGSSSQVPALPCAALVSTLKVSPILSRVPEVSTNPPSPPRLPPLALMLPSICVVLPALARSAIKLTVPPLPLLFGAASTWMMPLCVMRSLASSRMTPPLAVRPLASRLPLLFTTPPCKWLSAWALRMIRPPGACTALPLSTSAAMLAGVTRILAKVLLPSNCNSKTSPAASATVPSCATMTPLLRTSGASRAT